eukprot:1607220-Pleurochrysis_carterae.AAC.1
MSPNGASLRQVGGNADVKKHMRLHVALPLRNHTVCYSTEQLIPPLGLLLRGPPGTGKTMLARAAAVEAGVPLLPVRASDVENKYYGESTKIVRSIFTLARKIQPCIVFIDEIDALVRDRGRAGSESQHGYSDDGGYSLKCEILQSLDDLIKDKASVVVIAASNHASSVDAALHRRLPVVFDVPLPDGAARLEILNGATNGQLPRKVSERVIAETDGYSGSDIIEIVRGARGGRNESILERVDSGMLTTSELHKMALLRDTTIPLKYWMRAVESVRKSVHMRGAATAQQQRTHAA